MEMKKCHKCRTEKPATDEYFYRKKGYLTSPCKACKQKKQKKRAARPTKSRPATQRAYRTRNRTRLAKAVKHTRSDNRLLALWHYGGQPATCSCCGDAHIQFLCLFGRVAKQSINSGRLYKRLKDLGYPPGYVVMCQNCAHSHLTYGDCPHQR